MDHHHNHHRHRHHGYDDEYPPPHDHGPPHGESLPAPMHHPQHQQHLHHQTHPPSSSAAAAAAGVSSPVSTWTAVQNHPYHDHDRYSSSSMSGGDTTTTTTTSWLLVPEGQQPPQHWLAHQQYQQPPSHHQPYSQHRHHQHSSAPSYESAPGGASSASYAASRGSRPHPSARTFGAAAAAANAPPKSTRHPESTTTTAATTTTAFGSAPASSLPASTTTPADEPKMSAEEIKRLEDLKAAARAYALSSQTSTRPRRKKAPKKNQQPLQQPPPYGLPLPGHPQPPHSQVPRPWHGSHPVNHHPRHLPSAAREPLCGAEAAPSRAAAVTSDANGPPAGAVPALPPPPREGADGRLGEPGAREGEDHLPPSHEGAREADKHEAAAPEDDGHEEENENDDDDNDSVDEEYLQFVRGLGAAWGQGGHAAADDPLVMGLMDALSVPGDVPGSALDGPDDEDDDEFRLDSSSDEDDDEVPSRRGNGTRRNSPAKLPPTPGRNAAERGDGTTAARGDRREDDHDEDDDDDDDDDDWALGMFDARDLEWELNLLEQDDMDAAVATLLLDASDADEGGPEDVATSVIAHAEPLRHDHGRGSESVEAGGERVGGGDGPRESVADRMRGQRLRPSQRQRGQLRELLQKHYQLLLQQSVLAARLVHRNRSKPTVAHIASPSRVVHAEALISHTDSSEDLAEILDAAVGMLQDLDQNRKDAIRHYVQFSDPALAPSRDGRGTWKNAGQAQRALWATNNPACPEFKSAVDVPASPDMRRLTRYQFSKTLSNENREGDGITVFAIPGITKLKDTFAYIDKSVGDAVQGSLVAVPTHGEACRQLLGHASAASDLRLIPGSVDVSNHFLEPSEHLGPGFKPPCTIDQEILLRRNRAFFTVGEDSLVLRGVNLYGEKQWGLVCSRFLPNRPSNVVAQRYAAICAHLYKAHGIGIDDDGNLEIPPEHFSIDDVDEAKLATVHEVKPPAIINVHRWSLDEDLNLLRVVPIMGNMWAEIAARVLPHRDRGHIRKRYQVLSRRVKTAVQRMKNNPLTLVEPSTTQGKTPPRNLCDLRRESYELEGASSETSSKSATPKASVAPSSRSGRKALSPEARVHRVSEALTPRTAARDLGGAGATPTLPGKPFQVVQRPPKAATPQVPRPCATPTRKRSLTPKAQGQDASRAAFEQLVESSGPECSQMRRLGNMMSKDESADHGHNSLLTAGTVLARLAGGPRDGNSSMDSFPDMSLGDDPSGLSVLRTSLGTSPEKGPHDRKHGFTSAPATFLTGVLDRTRQRQSNGSRPTNSQPSGSAAARGAAEADYHAPSTPSKRRDGALDSSHGLPPFFSPEGAPNTLLSPPLTVDRGHSLWGGLSVLHAEDGGAGEASQEQQQQQQQRVLPPARPLEALERENVPRPEDSMIPPFAVAVRMRTGLEDASLQGHSTKSWPSSSSSSTSSPPTSAPPSLLLPPETSIPLFGGTPSSSPSNSRAGAGAAAAAASAYGSPLGDDGGIAGVLLMEPDLEAISALNSMSHSPPEALGGARKGSFAAAAAAAASAASGSGAGRGARQSLFSRVVGRAGGSSEAEAEAAAAAAAASASAVAASTAHGVRDRRRSSSTSRPVVTAKKRRLRF